MSDYSHIPKAPPQFDQPCEGKENSVLWVMHNVNRMISRRLGNLVREHQVDEATMMHGWILGYLSLRQEKGQDVYQRDLEDAFRITRSTVSSILRLMEHKGYILRESVPEDARLKRVVLTERGRAVRRKIIDCFREMDVQVTGCITPEERLELLRILKKLESGLN